MVDWQDMRKDAPAAMAPPVYYRAEPVERWQSVQTEVSIPLLQAAIVGMAWGVLAGLVVGGLAHWLRFPLVFAPVAALAVGLSLFAWQVTRLLAERRDLLWRRERVEGRDLDGDGIIGQPTTTRVEVVDKRNGRIRYLNLPLDDAALERLARAAMVKRVDWSRRNLADAGALTEEAYSAVVGPMLAGGLLAYRGNGPTSGIELTATGRAFLRQYLG